MKVLNKINVFWFEHVRLDQLTDVLKRKILYLFDLGLRFYKSNVRMEESSH